MSGIIGSKLNIRGSGGVAKLGTDGQILTSSGAGVAAAFEDASAGGTSWQSVETGATFTAVAGNGYPVNTTAQACTVTLPASASVGDTIEFTDYARNFATNALTINPNSLNYQGNTSPNPVYDTDGESISITYVDATKGWVPTSDGAVALETPQSYAIEWLVIGAGGGGGTGTNSPNIRCGGGGGAGGYRNNFNSETTGGGGSETNTELDAISSGTVLTIDVGGGGAGGTGSSDAGTIGEESSIKGTGVDITSAGGGAGADDSNAGGAGGSGGGGGAKTGGGAGGAGTANQGYAGESGGENEGGGGGGAAEIGGTDGSGYGGDGLSSSITGAATDRGGGGGGFVSSSSPPVPGGTGGGGASGTSDTSDAVAGTANTGGGGGGAGQQAGANPNAAAGGSGVVILRMADADYSGTTTGSPTIAQNQGAGSDETILTFNADGSYTT